MLDLIVTIVHPRRGSDKRDRIDRGMS